MKTIYSLVLTAILAGLTLSNAIAQRPHEEFRCSNCQRCAVANCSEPAPAATSSDFGRPDDRNEPDLSSRKSKPESAKARYYRINEEAVRTFKEAITFTSYSSQNYGYMQALRLFREQQAIKDDASVRDVISQLETLILWNQGVMSDQKGEYWKAVQKLNNAYDKRPSMFSEANFNYMREVRDRHLNSLPNSTLEVARQMAQQEKQRLADATLVDTVGVPSGLPRSLDKAIADVFSEAPFGVSDRVRKGFQAVMVQDWEVARAWIQDALNRDPGNEGLQSFMVALNSSVEQTFRRLERDRHTDFARNPLHTLNDNTISLSKEQITNALAAVLVEARCSICRQPRKKP